MNDYFEVFFDFIEQNIELPEQDKDLCRKLFRPALVPKGTLIEESGTIHSHHNFLVSGFMRSFIYNNHEEVTTDLGEGPRFFTSYFHFMHQTKSNENLQAITDCALLRISFADVAIAAEQGITQKDYTAKVLNEYMEKAKQRTFDMTHLSGELRYQKMCKENPRILQHVPLKHIASYLGITQRHLSRLRNITF